MLSHVNALPRALAAAAVSLGLAGCGDSGTQPSGGGGGGGGGGTVPNAVQVIASGISTSTFSFFSVRNTTKNPSVDTVAVGGTVTWSVERSTGHPHGVVSVGSPTFTTSPTMTNGESHQVTFSQPGVYEYQCTLHGNLMTGRIVVQ